MEEETGTSPPLLPVSPHGPFSPSTRSFPPTLLRPPFPRNRARASPRLSTASDPALTKPLPPRDCQLPRTLRCPDPRLPEMSTFEPCSARNPASLRLSSASGPALQDPRLPESVNHLRPCSAQTPASPRMSTTSGPALPRLKPPRDCQLHRTLLCPDSGLSEIVKCLRPYSNRTQVSSRWSTTSDLALPRLPPKLSSASDRTLPRLPPPQNYQVPRAPRLSTTSDSALRRLTPPEIDSCLRPHSAQTCALPTLSTASHLLCTGSRLPETASDAHSLLSYNLVVEYEQLSAPTERLPPPRLSMTSIVPNFPILRPLAPQPWLGF